jgi:Nucleotidyltransferase domain
MRYKARFALGSPAMRSTYELQRQANALLNWFLDIRSTHIEREGEHRAHAIADSISAMYGVLADCIIAERNIITKIPARFEPIEYQSADLDYRLPVINLVNLCRGSLQDHAAALYLHGSLATKDYSKGWSDVDTFLVVRDETLRSPVRLVELRRRTLDLWSAFLKVCPLQHHGFIVAGEIDLMSYPSSFMPVAVFDHALTVFSQNASLRFGPKAGTGSGSLRSILGRKAVLHEALRTGIYKHHPHSGVYLRQRFENADEAMPQLFAFLGYVMTIPSYVADAIGQGCYKRDSFRVTRDLFSAQGWALIERASQIRSRWQCEEYPTYSGVAVPQWLQRDLGPDYLEAFAITLDDAQNAIKAHSAAP